MTEFRYLTIDDARGIVTCTMSNPPRHTLVAAEVTELDRLITSLEARDDVRVLVFTGAEAGVFIAHYEVGELAVSAERSSTAKRAAAKRATAPKRAAAPKHAAATPLELHPLHRCILRLQRASFVTVAAINGNTMGGGLEFALGCDFRLAMAGEFRLGLPETGVGIIPGAGGTQRFARLLGTAKALDLILHAQTLSPAEALAHGLVHRVFEAAAFRQSVDAFATDLAGRAPIALAAAKRAIYEGAELPLTDALLIEQREFDRCMASRDAATAMRSFLDGKPWHWQGR
jgi:enoyl-CoA hydratase